MTQVIIRTSDRNQFRRCRQKWDFTSKMRMNYEYVPGIEPLDFGIAIHAAMEKYYDPVTWHDAPVKEALALGAFQQAMKEWKDRLRSSNQLEMQSDRWDELSKLGVGMLTGYFEWAPPRDADIRPVYSEIEFEVPIPGTDYLYQGRIDLVVQDSEGLYWIWDHKTAATLGSTEHLELDPQTRSYSWAFQQMLRIPIAGVVYNELRKSAPHPPLELKNGGLSKNKAQLTSKALYRKEIKRLGLNGSDYEEFLNNFVEPEYFRRTEVRYSGAEMERTEQAIVAEAHDMAEGPAIYPNPDRFNCSSCAFRSPCLMREDGSDWKWYLESSGLYTKRK